MVYRTSEWLKITSTSNADRILAALGVGRQAEQYKRVKAVLDQLMPKSNG